LTAAAVCALAFSACGGSTLSNAPTAPSPVALASTTQPEPSPTPTPPAPTVTPAAVLVGAGDISQCGLEGSTLTARLMEQLFAETHGTGITLGDNSNDSGSRDQYDCFARTWGPFKGNLMPSPGNHDYETNPPYYYEYFGAAAGPGGLGYYSYDRGAWHIQSLNSELPESMRQAQLDWMQRDLQQHPTQCSLAYFHRPLFSSGLYAAQRMKRLWDVLYRNGVDVIVNGHEHFFAAFPVLDPDGRPDPQYGIRQLIAGTGGARLFDRPSPQYAETIVAGTWGALVLTLGSEDYRWRFVAVDGAERHSGTGTCHGVPPAR
jgi:acid phosphatase type 7